MTPELENCTLAFTFAAAYKLVSNPAEGNLDRFSVSHLALREGGFTRPVTPAILACNRARISSASYCGGSYPATGNLGDNWQLAGGHAERRRRTVPADKGIAKQR
jgi:hypothetical protein